MGYAEKSGKKDDLVLADQPLKCDIVHFFITEKSSTIDFEMIKKDTPTVTFKIISLHSILTIVGILAFLEGVCSFEDQRNGRKKFVRDCILHDSIHVLNIIS